MSGSYLARIMVTVVAAGQGITPLFVDLNRTHATNPLWPGHARFHVVWQTFALTLGGAVEIGLIWGMPQNMRQFFYVAALLTSLPMLAFLVAMIARGMYAGTLHDPNGIKPVHIRMGGRVREIDMNAVLVIVGAMVLVIAAMIF